MGTPKKRILIIEDDRFQGNHRGATTVRRTLEGTIG
jgi:hypothetical protein